MNKNSNALVHIMSTLLLCSTATSTMHSMQTSEQKSTEPIVENAEKNILKTLKYLMNNIGGNNGHILSLLRGASRVAIKYSDEVTGDSLLHHAIKTTDVEMFKVMLETTMIDSLIEIRNSENKTAMDLIAERIAAGGTNKPFLIGAQIALYDKIHSMHANSAHDTKNETND